MIYVVKTNLFPVRMMHC